MSALAQRYDPWEAAEYTAPQVTKGGLSDQVVQKPQHVSVSSSAFSRQEATWLPAAAKRILSLCELPLGWDSYHGVPVDRVLGVYAIHVLTSLVSSSTPQGAIHPLSGGGVQVEWHRNGRTLEIAFYAPYDIEAILSDGDGNEQIVAVQENLTRLKPLIWEISK